MRNIFTAITLLFIISANAQSPWTKKKGEAYTQISYNILSKYSGLYGDLKSTERFITDKTLSLYSEIGITKDYTFLVNLPIKFLKAEELSNKNNTTPLTSEGSLTTIGNINIGVKRILLKKKKWLLSGQLTTEINTSTFDRNTGLSSGYDTWTVSPLIIAGLGLNKLYFQLYTGAELRFKDYSNNLKFGGEVGYKIIPRIWLVAFLKGTVSFKDGSVILPLRNLSTGTYINNQQYVANGFKVIGELTDKLGVNASFTGALFADNVARREAMNFGIYYKIK